MCGLKLYVWPGGVDKLEALLAGRGHLVGDEDGSDFSTLPRAGPSGGEPTSVRLKIVIDRRRLRFGSRLGHIRLPYDRSGAPSESGSP